MLIGPAEELGAGDDDPEWQEAQRNADESARLTPDKRMILFMDLSSIQIQIGQGWGARFSLWSGDCTLLLPAGAIAVWVSACSAAS
jgi:hypothetical protein